MKAKRNPSVFYRRTLCLIALFLLSALLLAACAAQPQAPADDPVEKPAVSEETVPPTQAPTEPPTEPTEPPPTCPPDGNPEDITCQGSYTAGKMELSKNSQTVVATAGKQELTNGQLQIYYQTAVNTYREAGHENGPDLGQPMDIQLLDLNGTEDHRGQQQHRHADGDQGHRIHIDLFNCFQLCQRQSGLRLSALFLQLKGPGFTAVDIELADILDLGFLDHGISPLLMG